MEHRATTGVTTGRTHYRETLIWQGVLWQDGANDYRARRLVLEASDALAATAT
ncbi:MAG: hypothetical protein ABTS22_06630 [Accumulibacter sp.]|uniref:hypothetical protein n=1 Tax=Accumulibacter sp. TaxID=2053492 RepID=UPI001ACF089E|nr:hypothetical protein [Accumulibacter sp.]MBN8437971.1 hypothetical protein [Accumulibacter sp.]